MKPLKKQTKKDPISDDAAPKPSSEDKPVNSDQKSEVESKEKSSDTSPSEPEPKPREAVALPSKREKPDPRRPTIITSQVRPKEKERFQSKAPPATPLPSPEVESEPSQEEPPEPIPVDSEPVPESPQFSHDAGIEAPFPVKKEKTPATGRKKLSDLPPVVFLISLGVAGLLIFVLGIMVMVLSMKNDEQAQHLASLREELEKKDSYKDSLIAPPEILRGQVITRAGSSNARQPVSRVSVMLFKPEQVEEALKTYQDALNQSSSPADFARIRFPNPLASSLTDSRGFYSLDVPEPGTYVVMARVSLPKKKGMRMWLLQVDTKDRLNTPVDLTDLNRISAPTSAPIVNWAR